jgi:hypothetical protein
MKKRNYGLLKALDNLLRSIPDFNVNDSPLRGKKAKNWLRKIGKRRF